jgi:hypothetical protein
MTVKHGQSSFEESASKPKNGSGNMLAATSSVVIKPQFALGI